METEDAIAEKLSHILEEYLEESTNHTMTEGHSSQSSTSSGGIYLFTGELAKDMSEEASVRRNTKSRDKRVVDTDSSDDAEDMRVREASVSAAFILEGCTDYTRLYGSRKDADTTVDEQGDTIAASSHRVKKCDKNNDEGIVETRKERRKKRSKDKHKRRRDESDDGTKGITEKGDEKSSDKS